jgi:hypothetical protein
MQATAHTRQSSSGRTGPWLPGLMLAVSLALGVAGGLALTGNLPWQGDTPVTDTSSRGPVTTSQTGDALWVIEAQQSLAQVNAQSNATLSSDALWVIEAQQNLAQPAAQPFAIVTSDALWAIEAQQGLAQMDALAPLKAYWSVGQGEGRLGGSGQ